MAPKRTKQQQQPKIQKKISAAARKFAAAMRRKQQKTTIAAGTSSSSKPRKRSGTPKSKQKKSPPKEGTMYYRNKRFWVGNTSLKGAHTFLDTRVLELIPDGENIDDCELKFSPGEALALETLKGSATLSSYQRTLEGQSRGKYIHGQINRLVNGTVYPNRITNLKMGRKAKPHTPHIHPMARLAHQIFSAKGIHIYDSEVKVHWPAYLLYGAAVDMMGHQAGVEPVTEKEIEGMYFPIETKTGKENSALYRRPKYRMRCNRRWLVSEMGRDAMQSFVQGLLFNLNYPDKMIGNMFLLHIPTHTKAYLYEVPQSILDLRPFFLKLLSSRS